MRLDTSVGEFTVHFLIGKASESSRRVVTATLRRDRCARIVAADHAPGRFCTADSPAAAEITAPKSKPFRRATARATALAKCMARMGLNKTERIALWSSYFAQVNVLPRICVGAVTTCTAGHRLTLRALSGSSTELSIGTMTQMAEAPCSMASDGKRCGRPMVEAKHRYLYRVDLPEGKRGRRTLAAARATGFTSFDDDVPY